MKLLARPAAAARADRVGGARSRWPRLRVTRCTASLPCLTTSQVPHTMLPAGLVRAGRRARATSSSRSSTSRIRFNHAKHLVKDIGTTLQDAATAGPTTSDSAQDTLAAERHDVRRLPLHDHVDLDAREAGRRRHGPVRVLPPRLQGRATATRVRRARDAAGEPASSTTRRTSTGTSAARSATARSTSSSSRRATSSRACAAASTATRCPTRRRAATAKSACDTCHLRGDSTGGPTRIKTMFASAARCCRRAGCTTPSTRRTSSSGTSASPPTTRSSAPTATRKTSAPTATTDASGRATSTRATT